MPIGRRPSTAPRALDVRLPGLERPAKEEIVERRGAKVNSNNIRCSKSLWIKEGIC